MARCSILVLCLLAAVGCAGLGAAMPPGSEFQAHANGAPAASPFHIAEFAIATRPAGKSIPYAIATGPDGAMWFTEEGGDAIGRIDSAGTIRQFRLPSLNAQPEGIASGPGGSLYFAENQGPNPYATHLGRITTRGVVTEWNDSNFMPEGVAAASDGDVWFTQGCGNLAILTSSGTVKPFQLQGGSGETTAIVKGPDGAIWFARDGTAVIGRIAAHSPTLQTYAGIKYEHRYNDLPHGVAAGPDGNLWWTALLSGVIWATDMRGSVVHVYKIPTPNAQPWSIVAGRDGALWFTEWGGDKIGRVTTAGTFSEYPLPTRKAQPQGIATGPDGTIWFVESGAGKIGKIAL